jgi:hypothetical protein
MAPVLELPKRRQSFRLQTMPRQLRLSPVHPKIPPSASRWRARPQTRNATDEGDDGAFEEWMIGYPSVARTVG